jgi:hypothetical protein
MSSRFAKYRKTVVMFGLIGLVLLVCLSFLIDTGVRHSDLEETGKVNKITNHVIDPDLIIFGSSVSQVGVDPAIIHERTNLSTYNCSINGTRFLQYKGLIDEFASYSKNNRYVVFVETFFSFETVDALTMPENFLSEIQNPNIYNSLYSIQPDLAWRCRYIPFYRYVPVSYRYYKQSVIGWHKMIVPSVNNDTNNGYLPVDRQWEADADDAINNMKPFKVQIDERIVQKYITTIQKLEANGEKVFLVLTPMYNQMFRRVTDITPVREVMKGIAEKTGANLLDYTQSSICEKKSFFYNSNHLNRTGAEVFSGQLADTLRNLINGKDQAIAK